MIDTLVIRLEFIEKTKLVWESPRFCNNCITNKHIDNSKLVAPRSLVGNPCVCAILTWRWNLLTENKDPGVFSNDNLTLDCVDDIILPTQVKTHYNENINDDSFKVFGDHWKLK